MVVIYRGDASSISVTALHAHVEAVGAIQSERIVTTRVKVALCAISVVQAVDDGETITFRASDRLRITGWCGWEAGKCARNGFGPRI